MKLLFKFTTLTTTSLLITCLLNVIPTISKASPKSHLCERIRQFRHLALQENWDGENLATLEAHYCNRNRYHRSLSSRLSLPPKNASQDCVDLTVMKRLAQMTTRKSYFVSLIQGEQQITCQFSQQRSSFDWSNQEKAKWGANWYYPNGEKVKWESVWYYPNGKKAKWGTNWYYPNGEKVKWGSNWYDPEGNRVSLNSLLGWSCGVVGTEACHSSLTRLSQTKGFWYELEVLELSWKAYQMRPYYH